MCLPRPLGAAIANHRGVGGGLAPEQRIAHDRQQHALVMAPLRRQARVCGRVERMRPTWNVNACGSSCRDACAGLAASGVRCGRWSSKGNRQGQDGLRALNLSVNSLHLSFSQPAAVRCSHTATCTSQLSPACQNLNPMRNKGLEEAQERQRQ